MKKYTKRWAILLILALIFTSSGLSVFAEGTDGTTAPQTTQEAQEEAAPQANITYLIAYPGAKQSANPNSGTVTLYWMANNAVRYDVFIYSTSQKKWVKVAKDLTNSNVRALPAHNRKAPGKKVVSYTATGLDQYKTYSFIVRAYNSENAWTQKTIKKQPIRPINYVFTMKGTVKLSSHAGKSQSITLKKGEKVKAYGFSKGKYIFKRKGSIFYVNKTRCKKIYANYAKNYNYNLAEAENYVNTANFGSNSKNTLIWVSTYCQHVYYFKGSKGNWKCVRDWECSTGAATTPSPTGNYGNKEIHKFIRWRHGLQYWTCYSTLNAFHSKQRSWKMGKPASGGCIRNELANAKWLYNHVPKRTKTIIG